jgi:hypothetical protein
MVQSLTEPLPDGAAQAAQRADHQDRDSVAWNVPRASVRPVPQGPYGLDWNGFRDLYYPGSRRHNLAAIVAYGAYKKRSSFAGRLPASEAPHPKGDSTSAEPLALQYSEDEGGMSG